MKATHILVVKTESNGDFLSINTQDLKTVQINPEKETATIVTSSAKTTLACMTRHRLERLSKELHDRYNIFHLESGKNSDTKKDNTIIVVEKNGAKTYIWPKALFYIMKRGSTVTISAFGGMELKFDDVANNVSPILLANANGMVKI